ncbi:MAG TPA: type 1 glutamine amidotransferase [Paracoccaceae bacterium]|nr:type 1 glutamine amidotransferase [Paracoccaceae bacterium]
MRIGILEAGEVGGNLAARHGAYPAMFRRLLSSAEPGLDFLTIRVVAGERPDGTGQADAWLVTGSRHGVYDDLPWIAPLKDFLRQCVAEGVPVAGICFGHQILAEALGGRAEKSSKGWGLGVHSYRLLEVPAWMEGARECYAGLALHQDQVAALPADATVLATSAHCEIAAVAYGDPEHPRAVSVQSHPEFSPGFVADIIAARRGKAIPEPVAEAALATLDRATDDADWARWILRYFRDRLAQRPA